MIKSTKKETAKSVKTLLVMLQSMRGQQVTITLRNDSVVRGTIIKVDANMNIELENATMEQDLFYQIETGQQSGEDDNHSERSMSVDEEMDNKSTEYELLVDTNESDKINNIDQASKEDFNTEQGANRRDQCLDNNTDTEDENENEDDNDRRHGKDLEYFLVKGTRVRHIDIPADYDLLAGGKSEIERIRDRSKQWTKRDIVRPTTATTITTSTTISTTNKNTNANKQPF